MVVQRNFAEDCTLQKHGSFCFSEIYNDPIGPEQEHGHYVVHGAMLRAGCSLATISDKNWVENI